MTPEQKKLIAAWAAAWASGDEANQDRINRSLKQTGMWAYESGVGVPTFKHWYNGLISPGMRFIWNPETTRQTCKVTRVTTDGDEPMVWCIDDASGREVYNEESHFRSMAVPV